MLNIAGNFNYNFSLSVVTRNIYYDLVECGVDVSTIPFAASRQIPVANFENTGYKYPVTLLSNLFFNAKDHDDIYKYRVNSKYVIGFWFWEAEGYIVPEFYDAIKYVDEIWVCTDYLAKIFSSFTDKPIIKIPYHHRIIRDSNYNIKRDLQLDDKFVFIFNCHLSSNVIRKNPFGIIDAFKLADLEDAVLIIKTIGYHRGGMESTIETMERKIGRDPRIIWINKEISTDRMMSMIKTSDCYVSLHRSEGLGLGMLEAMMMGVPVIATGYSGNMDFTKSGVSFPVNYTLVKGSDPEWFNDQVIWAEPSIDEAVTYMKYLYNHRDCNIGQVGQSYVKHKYSAQKTTDAIVNRLNHIYGAL